MPTSSGGRDDAPIDDLAAAGTAYVPFFSPGGFSPIRSQGVSDAARSLDATPMPAALAWLLRRSPNLLPVPGTSWRGPLRENRAAAALDGLADERARPGADRVPIRTHPDDPHQIGRYGIDRCATCLAEVRIDRVGETGTVPISDPDLRTMIRISNIMEHIDGLEGREA